MADDKKKYGGNFPRGGAKIRRNASAIKEKQGKQVCPQCGKKKAKRVAPGIYECKCGAKFTGGAYSA